MDGAIWIAPSSIRRALGALERAFPLFSLLAQLGELAPGLFAEQVIRQRDLALFGTAIVVLFEAPLRIR